MSERNQLLTALVQEVLGPRLGIYENLPQNQDPRDEYICGVLAPVMAPRNRPEDIDGEIDLVIEETSSDEDAAPDSFMVAPSVFSPALDPKSLPRSIGLSFTLEAQGNPSIEICATWARYQRNAQGWLRQPEFFLSGPVAVSASAQFIAGVGVILELRSQVISHEKHHLSLFLVNNSNIVNQTRAETPDHLFQPQIRVRCCPGTSIIPVDTVQYHRDVLSAVGSIAEEDESLTFLYRDRNAMGRGHMTGVVWAAIDPERPHESLPTPAEGPFFWNDGLIVPEEERQKFSLSDIRTDMTPCYPVEAPQMDWDSEYGRCPELDPIALAETWSTTKINENLRPLVEGYQRWISRQQLIVDSLSENQRTIPERHLNMCQTIAERIHRGIDFLIADEDVRLAFCFANKAIALQSNWSRTSALTWRPFQLAFILLNIAALADPNHPDRRICDLLWFPTGGGKTEAYLCLAAFALALRRRKANHNQQGDQTGAGVAVLSRYTLRLLTIQQFRRALGVITACEFLRVYNLNQRGALVGWRPSAYSSGDSFLWGGVRFSVALWVGGNVTPNNLLSIGPMPINGGLGFFSGALDILQGGTSRDYDGPNTSLRRALQNSSRIEANGEPAQVLNCPCCAAMLAVPDPNPADPNDGLGAGVYTLHFVYESDRHATVQPNLFQILDLTINAVTITPSETNRFFTLSITFAVPDGKTFSARQVDRWWYSVISPVLGNKVLLASARPARPGYFILTFNNSLNNDSECDFDIYCPNPECELNQYAWAEQVPVARTATIATGGAAGIGATNRTAELPARSGLQWQTVPLWAQLQRNVISNKIPIPAITVDDQVYHRCPSLVIATVDKFARLAFEPKASSLFGNVSHYHARWGYYREGAPPSTGNLPTSFRLHPPGYSASRPLHIAVRSLLPPSLILQDELHLIEGPLGSMVGIYETAIDELSQYQIDQRRVRPKYIASTATVRQAETQVQSLFNRSLAQFPPWAISADDRFFARDHEVHPLATSRPGRLSVAICAPGKGAQTPLIRIWSSLLQRSYLQWQANPSPETDNFYSLIGYFNAIRELAGAVSLFRQDIPERIAFQNAAGNVRTLERFIELSSRANSLELPGLLEKLSKVAPDTEDAAFATSMFGTGVDISRLGLMIVHGQPKTTAAYIQATGRVGRERGGLVVTFLRASRPRDLDHYEFFTGYHRGLYRYVEAITVAPFSPRARERALGPLAVVLLRQASRLGGQLVHQDWRVQQRLSGSYFSNAVRMLQHRHDLEVNVIPELLETRASSQPNGRRPQPDRTSQEADSELDRWRSVAAQQPSTDSFVYNESSFIKDPTRNVVLGDSQHRAQGLSEAFENAPQSLRDVEETTGFRG